jgi:cytochrome P450
MDELETLHARYKEARSQHPVFNLEEMPAPLLVSYKEVDGFLASKQARCQEGEVLSLSGITAKPIWDFWNQIMFSKNGDEHRRLRQLVHGGYTRAKINPERGIYRSHAETLIAGLERSGPIDLVSQLIEPMVAFGICFRAGYDEIDYQRIMAWGSVATRVFTGVSTDDQEEVAEGFVDMFDHLDEIIIRREKKPQNKLIDKLISAHLEGKMSRDELRAMMGNIVIGGYATTQFAFIWLVWYVMHTPALLAKIRRNPDLIPLALREVLRLEPPVEATYRTTTEDLDIEGCPFKKNDTFLVSLVSANRDEKIYDNADQLDINRNQRLLSFGAGPHRCLGAALASAIIEESSAALLALAPNLSLVSAREDWSPAQGFREVDELIVKLGK